LGSKLEQLKWAVYCAVSIFLFVGIDDELMPP